ncbi:unnamed protein product [Clonostachys solani]|uniref:Uncharacterized protein n=1 Tax=Clonostachys solani TaxID=160281 RepID=A0A9N9WAI4_9HYPO|nr:unnamed protein product [Clonostachys solani]
MEQSAQHPEPWRRYLFACEVCNKALTHLSFNNDALLPFASSSAEEHQRIPKEALLSAKELSKMDDAELEDHLSAQKGPLRCNECWFQRMGLDHMPSRFEYLHPSCCMEFDYPLPRMMASQEHARLPTGRIRCTGCYKWQGSDRYRWPRIGAGHCDMCPATGPPNFIKVEWRDLGKKSHKIKELPDGLRGHIPCIDWHEVVNAEPSLKNSDKERCKGIFRQWEARGDPLRVWAALFHLREHFGEHRGELEKLFSIMVGQGITFSTRSYYHSRLQHVLSSLKTDASNEAANWVFSGEWERKWQVFSRVMARHFDKFTGVSQRE